MIGQVDVAGILLSPLLPCLLVAFVARLAMSWVLSITGAYRFVWNRPLFDLSLFLILLGVAFALLTQSTTS